MDLCGRSLLKPADLSAGEFGFLVEEARRLRNNTANSLLVTGAALGMDARICAPAALQPAAEVRGIAAGLAAGSGARLLVTEDVDAGVTGADFIYTDVWLSLGEPEDQWDARIDQLLPYQVNAAVMKATG